MDIVASEQRRFEGINFYCHDGQIALSVVEAQPPNSRWERIPRHPDAIVGKEDSESRRSDREVIVRPDRFFTFVAITQPTSARMLRTLVR
jgi:hypothetical protein